MNAGGTPKLVSECTNVAQGYYADREGMTEAQTKNNLCAAGYYCEAASRDKFGKPCPAGQYQDTMGQHTCKACTIGHYCLGATVWPIPCPAGYFCEAGVIPTDSNFYTKSFP
jgi:hypothetical protein